MWLIWVPKANSSCYSRFHNGVPRYHKMGVIILILTFLQLFWKIFSNCGNIKCTIIAHFLITGHPVMKTGIKAAIGHRLPSSFPLLGMLWVFLAYFWILNLWKPLLYLLIQEYASDCEEETHLAMTLKKQLFIMISPLLRVMITLIFSLSFYFNLILKSRLWITVRSNIIMKWK